MTDMTKAVRARYTLEFKQEAVRRVESGQSIAAAARTLGLVEQTLFNWVTGINRRLKCCSLHIGTKSGSTIIELLLLSVRWRSSSGHFLDSCRCRRKDARLAKVPS